LAQATAEVRTLIVPLAAVADHTATPVGGGQRVDEHPHRLQLPLALLAHDQVLFAALQPTGHMQAVQERGSHLAAQMITAQARLAHRQRDLQRRALPTHGAAGQLDAGKGLHCGADLRRCQAEKAFAPTRFVPEQAGTGQQRQVRASRGSAQAGDHGKLVRRTRGAIDQRPQHGAALGIGHQAGNLTDAADCGHETEAP